ncbi:MAG TPA: hypothetical protein VED63_07685 [Acidimicrobiales bacterium]|nr:hypothetical protein [Acidimicrobiales bacterium]
MTPGERCDEIIRLIDEAIGMRPAAVIPTVKVVQARLGHSSAKTTLDIYGHLFADEEDRTRAAVETEFASPTAWGRPGDAAGPPPDDEVPAQGADSA